MPDREKVIAALHCRAYDDDFQCWQCAYYRQHEKPVVRCDYRGLMDDAIVLLKEQPEIVRCKDCKRHYERNCEIWNDGVYNPDWYCADGKRKEAST